MNTNGTMRALVIHSAGDVRLEMRDIPEPAAGEVRVRVERGGICGSDLHYYNHGGFGPIQLRQPMILGHEVSGTVDQLGADVTGLVVGDLVAVSPSRPCRNCRFCHEASFNQCLNMRFYGSAMPWPHVQGAFSEYLVADATQCVSANGLSSAEAALAEPFAVSLHATRLAGELFGKRVLVTGCGPIGVLSIHSARRAGALEIVAMDLVDHALDHARKAGADTLLNPTRPMADGNSVLDPYGADKGYFDVMYECSGAQAALTAGIAAMRPGGVIMQLGLGGNMSVPMMQLTAKELSLRGSFRFHEEFALAVDLMQRGLVDLRSLVTHVLPLSDAQTALELANDRQRAMKTQLDLSG